MVALFSVALIVSFVLIDLAVRRFEHSFAPSGEVGQYVPGRVAELSMDTVRVPAGVFLHKGHTWVGLEPSGEVRVGVDAMVHRALGALTGFETPAVGTFLKKGERMASLVSGKKKLTLHAPVDGFVREVNGNARSRPLTAKEDPYGRGWLCLIEPTNLEEDLKGLRIGRSAQEWLWGEVGRLGSFLERLMTERNRSLGVLAQDGGKVREGVLEFLGADVWGAFQREFLTR